MCLEQLVNEGVCKTWQKRIFGFRLDIPIKLEIRNNKKNISDISQYVRCGPVLFMNGLAIQNCVLVGRASKKKRKRCAYLLITKEKIYFDYFVVLTKFMKVTKIFTGTTEPYYTMPKNILGPHRECLIV